MGLPLSVVFAVMLSIELILHFNAQQVEGFFTEQCAEVHHIIHGSWIMGIMSMLLYYGLLLDFAVFSLKVSAFGCPSVVMAPIVLTGEYSYFALLSVPKPGDGSRLAPRCLFQHRGCLV